MLRIGLVTAWLVLLSSIIGAMFWYNDWVYKLPTPVPLNYRAVPTGTIINLSDHIRNPDNKPVFLHFYNPECPCSRFNKNHFRSLVDLYGQDVHFVAVVLSEKAYSEEEIQQKMGVKIPVTFDQSVAAKCGVYSTPQAAILDSDQMLYYRGNYNASRYCSDEKTAYAKMAVAGLLKRQTRMAFSEQASKSYGCTLPVCKN